MQDNRKTGIGGKVLLALTMIFFYLPILYIIVFSFNGSRSLTHLRGSLSVGMKRCSRTAI